MTTEQSARVEENLGLVHLCANRFKGRGIEYEDLYSAGCIGLVKAVRGFDESRGLKLSTYAVPVILGEIKRLFRDGGALKVSRSIKELSIRVVREREGFMRIHGREPQISELAAIIGVSEDAITEAVASGVPPMSLTEAYDDETGQIDIPTECHDSEISDLLSLRQVMEQLDGADRELLILRYFKNMTQTRTAEILGMTQVQISRREKKLLLKMREVLLA